MYLGLIILVLVGTTMGKEQCKPEMDLSFKNLTAFDVNSPELRSCSSDILWLSLRGNDLSDFSADLTDALPNVERLVLSENRRISFPSDGSPFLMSPSLIDLDCERCGIVTIYAHSLCHLPHLETLRLPSNGIKWINTSAFRQNRLLKKMDLSRNELTGLPTKLLKGQAQIEELDLSYNRKLAPRKDLPFLASDSLRVLKCNYCGFTDTQEATFSELTKLKELHLAGNKLLSVPFLPAPTVVVIRKGKRFEWRDQSNLIKQRQYGWRGIMIRLYLYSPYLG